MKVPYWQCTRIPDHGRIPKPLGKAVLSESRSPATSHGLRPALPAHAVAGKMLNGSVPAKCSARQWVMPGPPPERQGAGSAGCAALGVDGALLAKAPWRERGGPFRGRSQGRYLGL